MNIVGISVVGPKYPLYRVYPETKMSATCIFVVPDEKLSAATDGLRFVSGGDEDPAYINFMLLAFESFWICKICCWTRVRLFFFFFVSLLV